MESELHLTSDRKNLQLGKASYELPHTSENWLNGPVFGILIWSSWAFACNICESLGGKNARIKIILFLSNSLFLKYEKKPFCGLAFWSIQLQG